MRPSASAGVGAGVPDLVERDGELALLARRLGDVQRWGVGQVVLVGGEAGVGKSALVRRFGADRPSGTAVPTAACDALFTPRPLGPLLDLADRGDLAGALAAAMAGAATPHEAMVALAQDLRTRPGSVLVLEDLHWADEATLDVLRLLSRRIESVPALVLATYRDDALDRDHPLRLVLGELASNPAVHRLPVRPLSQAAVAELARPYAVDAAELYLRTSGNPFFVTEVLAAQDGPLPATVRDAVLARARRLSERARRLLEVVATVPPHAELWLLEAVAGDLVERLGEALASGMLVSGPDGVAFRHELARLAVAGATPPDQALDLHRAVLVALTTPPDGVPDVARLAHHAEAAGDVEAVLEHAPAAAEGAAAVGAYREAAAQYARALRFAGRLTAAQRATLLERRADAALQTDSYDEGIEALEEALVLRRGQDDVRGEGDVLRRLSELLWCPGRTQEAARAGAQAVEILTRLPEGRELALAYANLAHICSASSHYASAVQWATLALGLARRLGDDALAVRVDVNLAVAELSDGDDSRVLDVVDAAIASGVPYEIARAYAVLGGQAVTERRHALARRLLDEGLVFCDDQRTDLYRLYVLVHRARLALQEGRWDDAVDSAESVLRIPRTSTTPRILALVVLALVRARRGDPGHAELLDEAWSLAEPTGELPRTGPVAAARAEIAWLAGSREGVAAASEAVLGPAAGCDAAHLVAELADWRRRVGLTTPAAGVAPYPYALLASGAVAAAAAAWTTLGSPYEAALAGAAAEDEATLLEALEALQSMGAKPAAALVMQRLRDRGARTVPRGPRPSTRRNPANLTDRELDVLGLLADGLRNIDIAQRLVLSRRTVDHHVATILRKLGAGTRGEAVAHARQRGELPQAR